MLLLASCSQDPAPVRFGETGQEAPAGDASQAGAGAVPPLPGTKPALPVIESQPVADRSVEPAEPAEPDDLIARIARILLAEEEAPAPDPVVSETVATGTGTVSVVTVRAGDTLYGLARSLGVLARELAEINGLTAPYEIRAGERLTVPESKIVMASGTGLPTDTAEPAAGQPEPDGELRFIWPVEGTVISTFGPKSGGLHNDGINIAAPAGTEVRAAEDGVVAYSGDELRGYGNLVLLRHAGGWVTAYAHNARNLVARGQVVLRGDVIAQVGASGSVSRPQSHFELRHGTQAVDPLVRLEGG